MDLQGVILVRAILYKAGLIQVKQSDNSLKSSKGGQLNPYTLLTPDTETNEVTSELIMMHESFLRTKHQTYKAHKQQLLLYRA